MTTVDFEPVLIGFIYIFRDDLCVPLDRKLYTPQGSFRPTSAAIAFEHISSYCDAAFCNVPPRTWHRFGYHIVRLGCERFHAYWIGDSWLTRRLKRFQGSDRVVMSNTSLCFYERGNCAVLAVCRQNAKNLFPTAAQIPRSNQFLKRPLVFGLTSSNIIFRSNFF